MYRSSTSDARCFLQGIVCTSPIELVEWSAHLSITTQSLGLSMTSPLLKVNGELGRALVICVTLPLLCAQVSCQYSKQRGTWTGTITKETVYGKSGAEYVVHGFRVHDGTPFTEDIYRALARTDAALLVDSGAHALPVSDALVGKQLTLSGTIFFRVPYGPGTLDPLYGAKVSPDTVVEYEDFVFELRDPASLDRHASTSAPATTNAATTVSTAGAAR